MSLFYFCKISRIKNKRRQIQYFTGIYPFQDVEHGYFGNVNEQIQEVCQQLIKDDRLKNGYNAIGFSQGAQLL